MTVTLDPPAYVDAAYRWVPQGRRGSYGPEIVDFMASIGHEVDQEQADDVDALASYGAGGTYLALETCDIEPRQQGKTERKALPIAMADAWLFGHEVTWTAHRLEAVAGVSGVWPKVQLLIEAHGSLSRRVKEIVDQRSEWAVVLTNGGVMEFRVRGGGGGRGVPRDIWVVDEALFVSASAVGDRLPTLSSRPNPQVRYVSSACKETSTHLWSLVKRGRAGNDPSLVYVEISRCYDFTAKLLDRLRMPQWRIQISEVPAKPDCYASITALESKHIGEMSLGPAWATYDLEAIRIPTLVHEILHLTHRGLTDAITDDMHRWVGSAGYFEVHRIWQREIELWVDYMSRVLLDLLKDDIEEWAGEIWGADWKTQDCVTPPGDGSSRSA